MDEATADLKDMSETFSNLRNELLQTTEQVSKAVRGNDRVLIMHG